MPWALANGHGTVRETNKAALARELEKQVSPAETIPEPSVTIIDQMSQVQKVKGNDLTFSQLADSALTLILHEGANIEKTDVVFGVYREDSIKNAESKKREQHRNTVPKHCIRSPDPAMEKVLE